MKLKALLKIIYNWSPGLLAQNTFYASFWQIARLGIQTLYLILVARFLGVQGYGTFAGMIALCSCVSPVAGVGFGLVLVKNASRNPESLSIYSGRSFVVILISSPVLIIFTFLISLFFFSGKFDNLLLLSVACTEILFVALIGICANIFQGKENLGWSTFINVILSLMRLMALIILIIFGNPGIETFTFTYFFSTLVATLLILLLTMSKCGKTQWNFKGIKKDIKEGFSFAIVSVFAVAHSELDKTILFKLSNSYNTGIYSSAIRIISAASLPLIAFILSTVPRLFRIGELDFSSGMKASLKFLYPILLYGTCAGVGLYLSASFIPIILGNDFQESIHVIRWLSIIPVLSGCSSLMLTALTCLNRQRIRILVEGIGFMLNIILNLRFIPDFGTNGAVLSLIISQSTLNIILFALLIKSFKNHKL